MDNQKVTRDSQNGFRVNTSCRGRNPYVHTWMYRGKTRIYFRRKGFKVALPGPIGSAEFIKAYAAALGQLATTAPPKPPKPAPKAPSVPGECVYIIQFGKRDVVKIGFSTDIKRRFADLQAPSAEVLSLLVVFPGGRDLERQLHVLFAEQRIRNELFRYDHILDGFLGNVKFMSLPTAILHTKEMVIWFEKPDKERAAILRNQRTIERKATIIPLYPEAWNEARLEANRRKAGAAPP